MPRKNVDFLAFNAGIISPKALARIDVARTALSAETFDNWIPKTQGAMRIRPGTKYLGSSLNDTGAHWEAMVRATDDTELLEFTPLKMRIWKDDALLTRVTRTTGFGDVLADTGVWTAARSSGGGTVTFNQSGSDTGLVLDAVARGGIAKATRKLPLAAADVNKVLAFKVFIRRGPILFRCGTDTGKDDYIAETTLRTGYHDLAFTPTDTGDLHVTFQSDVDVDRILGGFTMSDTGTVVLTTPYGATSLDNIRTTQSADVIFAACDGVQQHMIERRNGGLSWSVVKYQTDDGPFIGKTANGIKLKVAAHTGNTTLTANAPFFTSSHVGALFWLYHEGYDWSFKIAAEDTYTDPHVITGIADSTADRLNERQWTYDVTDTFTGTIHILNTTEDKVDGPYTVTNFTDSGKSNFDLTTQRTETFIQSDRAQPASNLIQYYKIGFGPGDYTSGFATVTVTRDGGSEFGIVRVTGFTSSTVVNVEVLKAVPKTGFTNVWQEGAWSDAQGWPTETALHEGRLWWFGNSYSWGSESDDYTGFSTEAVGDARPIARVFGEGPVDDTLFAVPLTRLLVGNAGSVLAFRSTSFDEPLTADNMSVKAISTQGAGNLRALTYNNRGIFVQRTLKKLFEILFSVENGDFVARELTVLNPDILEAGVVDIGIQVQPDTRIHLVLADGVVVILSYEPDQNMICFSRFVTDTGTASAVEKVAVLPGVEEDQVYYHVRRTINGATKRFLEKWATEAESVGDTGLSYLADCAVAFNSGVASASVTGLSHLEGQTVVAWGNDTGQATAGATYGMDFSYDDTGGTQTLYTVSAGGITLPRPVRHAVVGLPYTADWKSTKLAYVAGAGTPLTQMKRTDHIGFVLAHAHNNGLFFGRDFDNLDPLPKVIDEGAEVDADKIFDQFDQMSMPFPGLWNSDSRICLRAKAPRPMTVLAAVPTIDTQDKA